MFITADNPVSLNNKQKQVFQLPIFQFVLMFFTALFKAISTWSLIKNNLYGLLK